MRRGILEDPAGWAAIMEATSLAVFVLEEIVFEVTEAPDGGRTARASGAVDLHGRR
ncbi:MAG: hypothetical protein AB7T37_03840 [Dehalococcoidia bacterium]